MSINKDIQDKIHSIQNTQKITKAMEMVAISKMRKIQLKINSSNLYLNSISQIITRFLNSCAEEEDDYFISRKNKRIGLILISTNRGLCGSLNTNLFKKSISHILKYKRKNIACDLFIIGTKGSLVFNSSNYNISINIKNIKNKLHLVKIVQKLKNLYKKKKIDRLFLASNVLKSKLIQVPTIIRLLPMKSNLNKEMISKPIREYIYEPDPITLLNKLVSCYLESKIYQCILENLACEQSARIIAMKNATDNSGNIIKDLQLIYNKRRQSNITRELIEIISGMLTITLN